MNPATLSIITATFAPRERGRAIGIWAGVSAMALAIGPLIGGIIVDNLNWNWIFFVNVPVGAIAIVVSQLVIRESRDTSVEQSIDAPGLVTSGGGLFFLSYALVEGNRHGWTSPEILVFFALAVCALSAFVALERHQRLAMLDLSLFRIGAFTGANKAREGRFEAADGGTLFLDELATLAGSSQAKLLRVLQTGEFERLGSNTTRRARVRVIAATNTNLRQAIRDGTFREDLFYRVNVIELEVPPLAERREDILPLARHFLEPGFELSTAATDALVRYPWPGNVRELQNTIRRACLLSASRVIEAATLNLSAAASAERAEPELDRPAVEQALARAGGVIAHAARDLGLSRQALYRRMEKLGLKADAPRPTPGA